MPDKKICSARCHICGEKIFFTYGNPKELIQHTLVCHDHETTHHFMPSFSLKKINSPNKLTKSITYVGKRQAAGSATLVNPPKDAPMSRKSVKRDSESTNEPDCLNNTTTKKNIRKSSLKVKDDECLPNCPNKLLSSGLNLKNFSNCIKLKIRRISSKSNDNELNTCTCQPNDMVCPSRLQNERSKSTEQNRRLSGSLHRPKKTKRSSSLFPDPVDKKCICVENRRISTAMETSRELSLPADKSRKNSIKEEIKRSSRSLSPENKYDECNNEICESNIPSEQIRNTSMDINRRSLSLVDENSNDPSEQNQRMSSNVLPTSVDKPATCNKTVCFTKNASDEPAEKKHATEFSPCNFVKRKGTKEMYKTTLETWTAGCGSIDCPKCQRKVVPLIRKEKNKIAFTSAGASLLLTCWPFCFLIPMMHNYSVNLYCPCCKYKLGVYNSSTGKTTSVCCKNQKNAPNT